MDIAGYSGDGCLGCSSMLLLLQFAGLHTKLEKPFSKMSTVVAATALSLEIDAMDDLRTTFIYSAVVSQDTFFS